MLFNYVCCFNYSSDDVRMIEGYDYDYGYEYEYD